MSSERLNEQPQHGEPFLCDSEVYSDPDILGHGVFAPDKGWRLRWWEAGG